MFKKVFSIALSVVLAAGLFPAAALADVELPEVQVLNVVTAQKQLAAEGAEGEGDGTDAGSSAATVSYTLQCKNRANGEMIGEPKVQQGTPGANVAIPAHDGYKCVTASARVPQESGQTVVLEYAKKVTVTVNAFRTEKGQKTEDPVALQRTVDGWEGEPLTVKAEDAVTYHTPDPVTITPRADEENEVTFYYYPIVECTVSYCLYKNGKTTTKVASSKVIEGRHGQVINENAAELFGYELVSVKTKTRTLEEGKAASIVFYYKKLPVKISFTTVTYVYNKSKVYRTAAGTNKAAVQETINDRKAQGEGGRMTGFYIKNTSQAIKGKIQYSLYQRGKGWTSWKAGGIAGSGKNEKKNYSGQILRIRLTEDLGKNYDVYYRAKIFGVGWTGWAKNGQYCGAKFDYGVHLRGIQVKIQRKGTKAPGSASYRYVNESGKNNFAKAVLYNKIKNTSSSSRYIIAVCTELGRMAVYQGSRGNWKRIKYWMCTTGQTGHLTPHGTFYVGNRGLHFGEDHLHYGYPYTAWHWTQITGQVLFHSVLYHAYSTTEQLPRGVGYGLGKRESGGCVRLEKVNAYWINTTIPRGTKVRIF